MKVSPWVVPLLVVVLAGAGVGAARLFAIPTLELDLAASGATPTARLDIATFTVSGVRCTDTARTAATTIEGVDGVHHFVAYASRNLVEITFDSAIIDRARLVALLEGPVYDDAAGEFRFGVFDVVGE